MPAKKKLVPKNQTHKATNLPEGWSFINAQAEHDKNPHTFEVPSKAECADLVKGDFVKIGLRNPDLVSPNGERFWVLIHSVKKTKTKTIYIAEINNDLEIIPLYCPNICCGDPIEFEPQHVMSTHNHNKNFAKHRKIDAAKN